MNLCTTISGAKIELVERPDIEELPLFQKPLFKRKPTQEEVMYRLLRENEFVTPKMLLAAGGGMRASERVRRLKAGDWIGRDKISIENIQHSMGTTYAVYQLTYRDAFGVRATRAGLA